MGKSKRRKQYRRIKHLMNKYSYLHQLVYPKHIYREYRLKKILGLKYKELPVFPNVKYDSLEHKERMEVFNYFLKRGYSMKEISSKWREANTERSKRGREYKFPKPPPQEKKDNQNPVTNGYIRCSPRNLRVPSKKRKNKMKNFKKSFPNYKS